MIAGTRLASEQEQSHASQEVPQEEDHVQCPRCPRARRRRGRPHALPGRVAVAPLI